MTNQIERLQAQFYSLNIDQKRGFIENLQEEARLTTNPEWRAYIQPFISRCITEYNDEILRPVATATREPDMYCTCGYRVLEGEKSCGRCGRPLSHGYASDSNSYAVPAPPSPPVPAPSPHPSVPARQETVPFDAPEPSYGPVHETYHSPPSMLTDILNMVTDAVPISGSTLLFATSIILVIFAGVGLMSGMLISLEMFEQLDRIVPLRGMSWLTSYLFESSLNLLRLVVGVLGIVCSMRPDIARKCRVLAVTLFAYRLFFAILSWNALRGTSEEITAAMGGYIILNIIGWILPIIYFFAAHKIVDTSAKQAGNTGMHG